MCIASSYKRRSPSEVLVMDLGNDRDRFFEASCVELDKIPKGINNNSNLCLVAVGAGSLESKSAKDWLSGFKTIFFDAPPCEVFSRNPHPYWKDRNLKDFVATEYSEDRKAIYNSATVFSVAFMTKDQAKEKFIDFLIKRILKT